jgi:hypothetical protein
MEGETVIITRLMFVKYVVNISKMFCKCVNNIPRIFSYRLMWGITSVSFYQNGEE